MSAQVTWVKGGTADFTFASDDSVVLRSTIPSPPGSRLLGALAFDPPVVIKVKIHGSKREEDGSFTLRGKLLEATRALREHVARLVVPPVD